MGIYDREYYQDERPAGIHVSNQLPMVGKLIVLNVAVYVVDIFMNGRLMDILSASPESIANPIFLWQTITYSFAHDPTNVSHIFWNMFALFVFGRDVEGVYGGKELLKIYLVTAVLGSIVWCLRNMASMPEAAWGLTNLLGASGAVTAITLLFCLHFPKRTILLMFVLPVPAWVLGMLVILANVFGLADPESQTAFDVHLVGAAFAFVYYKAGWNFSRFSFDLSGLTKRFKPQPKLKLHDPEQQYEDLDREADELLEKVKRDGINSLSERERVALESYSRRMRQKHR